VKTFPELGLRAAGVDVDLAPVLDLPDGPLGSRQFRSPRFGFAFSFRLPVQVGRTPTRSVSCGSDRRLTDESIKLR
jgi:hypothetical protein